MSISHLLKRCPQPDMKVPVAAEVGTVTTMQSFRLRGPPADASARPR
ncbi:MAG TPA: hypothetical protein VIK45_22180 [Candidatus Dormibacteraeota bacterium]